MLTATEDTPAVVLYSETNNFSISGRSLPEDAAAFYEPIISWIKSYALNPNKVTSLHICLDYFNSTSAKQLLLILLVLEDMAKAGHEANIVWQYNTGDELILARGKELDSLVELPFEFREL